jgi:hypothetical protein
VGENQLKIRAVGWFSSQERWFQTRQSIASYREHHGDSVDYYFLFWGAARDLARIDVPDYVRVVLPHLTHPHFSVRNPGLGITQGGHPRCLIVDYMLNQGHDAVMVVDGDMECLAPINDLWDSLENHDAFVTPHRIYPPPRDGTHPTIEHLGLSGNYNSGICGFANTENAKQFVEWWLKISIDTPEVSPHIGRYAEQGWLRFIGDYMDHVFICRDQGVNFAWWRCDRDDQVVWNDDESRFEVHDEQAGKTVPLRIVHYSHVDFNRLECIAPYQNRAKAGPGLMKLLSEYKAKVNPIA